MIRRRRKLGNLPDLKVQNYKRCLVRGQGSLYVRYSMLLSSV